MVNFSWNTKRGGGDTSPIEASDPLEALRAVYKRYHLFQPEGLRGFYSGMVGFFSYETIHYYENISKTESNAKNERMADSNDPQINPLQLEDMVYVIPRLVIWFDHTKGAAKIICNGFCLPQSQNGKESIGQEYDSVISDIEMTLKDISGGKFLEEYAALSRPPKGEKLNWKCNTDDSEYFEMITKAKEYIREGDIFQVVLSKRYSHEFEYDPFFLYRGLRATNPSPYMFYLNFPEGVLVGSSPEILVKKEKRNLILRPIAGTTLRGKNSAQDEKLGKELLASPKERAEHIMLVDLGRNDMGRICEYGSIEVDELMILEKYSHVIHIVSNIIGTLKKEYDAFGSIWASFPAGTVSGAPKVRAMQLIEELEKEARGAYAGCIGYFGFDGDMDTAITLRTMLVKDKKVYVQAGGGIVFNSSPQGESEEVQRKARALFKAVELFYQGELE